MTWRQHRFAPHDSVELFRRDMAGGNSLFPQGGALLVRRLGDGRSLVVADLRHKRGHKHERTLHQLGQALAVRLESRKPCAGHLEITPSKLPDLSGAIERSCVDVLQP